MATRSVYLQGIQSQMHWCKTRLGLISKSELHNISPRESLYFPLCSDILELKANGDVLCLYVTPLDFKLRTNNQLPATS